MRRESLCAYTANLAGLYSRRLTIRNYSRACHLFLGYANCVHGRVRSLPDDESLANSKAVICFQGTHTVPVTACNERLTPRHRKESLITRIIRDISRCPHRPVVSKFYCRCRSLFLLAPWRRDLLKFEPGLRIYMAGAHHGPTFKTRSYVNALRALCLLEQLFPSSFLIKLLTSDYLFQAYTDTALPILGFGEQTGSIRDFTVCSTYLTAVCIAPNWYLPDSWLII